MHYFIGVIIPNQDNVRNCVESLLAPYDENIESNEETHWDWWEIGGRWDSILKDNQKVSLSAHTIEDNIIKISEFLELEGIDDRLRETINKMLNKTFAIPYAIVSEEDGWIEGGEYGDNSTEHAKEWEKEAIKILKRNKDKYLVCVDCHC